MGCSEIGVGNIANVFVGKHALLIAKYNYDNIDILTLSSIDI